MWRAVLHAHNIKLPAHELLALNNDKDWGPPGVDCLSQKAQKISPIQNRPVPDHGDANYLLYKFLETVFPQGGLFESISDLDIPGAPGHVNQFVEFIQQLEYSTHPYQLRWTAALARDKPEMALLAKNIRSTAVA